MGIGEVLSLGEGSSERVLVREWAQRMNVGEEVVNQEFEHLEGADGFSSKARAGGERY